MAEQMIQSTLAFASDISSIDEQVGDGTVALSGAIVAIKYDDAMDVSEVDFVAEIDRIIMRLLEVNSLGTP